jgi:polysaccharide export outer membrane protein
MVVRSGLAVLLFFGFLLSGRAIAQNGGGRTDPPPEVREAPKLPAALAPEAIPAAVPKDYVIGAEDIINIITWRERDFSGVFPVRPDGKITLPLLGDVQAEGLTPERLSTQLEQALAEYMNKPDVTVTILQVNSKKFYISGEVNRPGQYPLVVPTRIFDALSNAGGFREFANKKDIVIVRGQQRLKFNWNDYLKGKKPEQNIFLESGDTIIVK